MTARKLIDEAIASFNTYRHPDLSEAAVLIDDILQAAGKGSIQHDTIETLDEYDGFVRLETSWSARGCAQSSDFEIPSSVFDAEDPIKAATIWGLKDALLEAKRHLATHQASVAYYQKRVDDIVGHLDTL